MKARAPSGFRRKEFRDHRKHDDDLAARLTFESVQPRLRWTPNGRRKSSIDRDASRARALVAALLRKAFEDLDTEFFRGRALELPELIPEPDHFALFLDSHGHLQPNGRRQKETLH